MGYSPWGHKELDTTERLKCSFFSNHISIEMNDCWMWPQYNLLPQRHRGSITSRTSLLFSRSVVSDSLLLHGLEPHQAPLSIGFPRQEYCSGLPFPLPEDLSDPGIKPKSLVSPALTGGFFTTEPSGLIMLFANVFSHSVGFLFVLLM